MKYVDLGLTSGTKWAECNLGANSPEQFGGYYAWGEVEEKDTYNKENYKWYDRSTGKYPMQPVCISGSRYYNDDSRNDAAYVALGEKWHTPSPSQFEELNAECTWYETTLNNVIGYRVVGPNGNSIFIPLAGDKYSDKIQFDNGYNYWCNELSRFQESVEYGFRQAISAVIFEPEDPKHPVFVANSGYSRYRGCAIRPVYDPDFTPVIIKNEAAPPDNTEPDPVGVVDLGLPSGILWATCNLGADSPEQDGNYYMWAGTTPRTSGFIQQNDPLWNAEEKYQTDFMFDIQATEYDVARKELGPGYAIPTPAQFAELKEYCTIERATISMTSVIKLTSRINGKYIYLPASGYKDGNYDRLLGSCAALWTSEKYQNELDSEQLNILLAMSYLFYTSGVSRKEATFRFRGFCIRPIYIKGTYFPDTGDDEGQDETIIPPDDSDTGSEITESKYTVQLGEWNSGFSTNFNGKLKCKLQYVVNKSPLTVKVFDNQEIVSHTRHDSNIRNVDEGLYFENSHKYSWATDLKQESETDALNMTAREGNYRYAVPRDGSAEYGNRMRGKYMICTIEDLDPRVDASIAYIITKFRTSWS